MNKLNILDWVTLVLVVVGGLNWGLVGIWELDLVALILGEMTIFSIITYILVALSATYLAVISFKLRKG